MQEGFHGLALIFTGICILAFILSSAFPDLSGQFILVSDRVAERPWTIVTHIFMHADLRHLYFNMFALALFGSILEKYIGSRKFLIVFFATGLASSAADLLFYEATLGASGAVFGLLGCLTIIRPRQIVLALGVPMYVMAAAVIWVLLDLTGMFYPDNVAHAAHLFGMGCGMAIGAVLRGKHKEPAKTKVKEAEISDKELDDWEEKYMKRH
ncbi:MAG: rhomboid family intramembrane serine protease [Candidatus Aenigmarchaeota archaeon]|nr:rhomboid family intramembrane serine protease [Candidatus Aenigmarchaeota archaeon]